MPPQRLTVVLLGQTGNGKSATGNSLLGRDAFAAKRSFASVTERCARRVSWLDEDDALVASTSGDDDAAGSVSEHVSRRTELCVIDTPGTCDSGALLEDNLAHISAHLRGEDAAEEACVNVNDAHVKKGPTVDAKTSCEDGRACSPEPARVHAFVLVLSAAARFTQEEAIALERLVGRLGKDALRHACVAVTRAEEITENASAGGDAAPNAESFAAELARSAPASLRRLMERMPYHASGAPPVLVENFPSDAYAAANATATATEAKKTRRFRAAAAPLLAAARAICEAVAVARGVATSDPSRADLAACAYEPEQLVRANAAATADPSTAALAMLDRLKRQLAEGAFGGGAAEAPDGMAAAARRAFEDLSAQFAARAAVGGGRAFAPAAATDRAAVGDRGAAGSRFGGLFVGSSDARADRAPRPETAFAGAAALAGTFEDDAFPETASDAARDGVTVRVSGFGDVVGDARGAFALGRTGGRLLFRAKASPCSRKTLDGDVERLSRPTNATKPTKPTDVRTNDDDDSSSAPSRAVTTSPAVGRARVAGCVSFIGGGFAFAVAGEAHAVTMHSPVFLSAAGGIGKTFRAERPVSDDDWIEENAHLVTLRAESCSPDADDADVVRVIVRGASVGDVPDVALVLDADARFELRGGSLSVWNAAVEARFDDPTENASSRDDGVHSLTFDGALDVAPGLEFDFGATAEARRAAFKARQTWPWRAAEDVSRD